MIRKRKASEAQVHSAVVEHLRLRAKPGALLLHPANGEHRDKITGAKLKRMGVLAGASDLLLWHRGNSFALELKSPGGRLSDALARIFGALQRCRRSQRERRRTRPRTRHSRGVGAAAGGGVMTQPKVIKKVGRAVDALRRPNAKLVRLHSNNGGAGVLILPHGERIAGDVVELLLGRNDGQPFGSGTFVGPPPSWRIGQCG